MFWTERCYELLRRCAASGLPDEATAQELSRECQDFVTVEEIGRKRRVFQIAIGPCWQDVARKALPVTT